MSTQLMRSVSLAIGAATVVAANHFVTLTSGLVVEVTDGDDAADPIVGVALESRTASTSEEQTIPVALLDGGILEVEAGMAISLGDSVYVGNDGRAYTGTTAAAQNPADTYVNVGIALDAAAAAGDAVTIKTGVANLGSTTTV